jgi:hypothetical protein
MRRSAAGFLVLAASLCAPASARGQLASDLRGDWSDAANPNGLWTYRQGTAALTAGTWTDDFAPQPAWVGAFPAVWLRAQSTTGLDVQVGDVVTHSGNGANVVWTSPGDGTVDISGGAWMLRDIGRSNDWFLRKNGVLLSSGSLSSGDPFDRAHPFDLDAGSGGALDGIPVGLGDQIELSFVNTSASGDYNGVNLTYTLTPVPEPSGTLVTVLAAGTATGAAYRRFKNKRNTGSKSPTAG